jgi:hypothetical protein
VAVSAIAALVFTSSTNAAAKPRKSAACPERQQIPYRHVTTTTADADIAAAIAETQASATDSLEAWAWLSLLRQVLDLDNDPGVGVH